MYLYFLNLYNNIITDVLNKNNIINFSHKLIISYIFLTVYKSLFGLYFNYGYLLEKDKMINFLDIETTALYKFLEFQTKLDIALYCESKIFNL